MYREHGKKALSLVLTNEQNINIFDKYIYEYCDKNYDENDENEIIEKNYKLILYNLINDIQNGKNLKELLNNIKRNKFNWNNDFYKDMILEENEQNNFIETPFEIEEGVLECDCGSKRVFSYQKQSRSADEPMSTYATCMACKKQWVYSG
jgi:DNA-directed RNA polymerase subunit M/transcription elongation factor TFIIS